jgi:hypothetical protein
MKIGICLIGISFNETAGIRRDFRLSSDNFNQMIRIPYEIDNEVSVYVTTYHNRYEEQLLETYKPKSNLFLDMANSHQRLTYIKGLELIENEDLDVIISTRYDIDFKKIIKDLDLDYDKFNVLFKELNTWDNHKFIDDNLFIFPKKYLSAVKESILKAHNGPHSRFNFLHNIYEPLAEIIGADNIKFMSEMHELSNYNTFYDLKRI